MSGIELGFPIWVRATHWFNVLFMTLLIRSGIAIVAGHPMLYWNQDCRPGWLSARPRSLIAAITRRPAQPSSFASGRGWTAPPTTRAMRAS